MDELQQLYATDDATKAEILQNALKDQGIACEIVGERQGGMTGLGIMKVRLFVKSADFERATAFIEQHERPEEGG